MSFQFKTLETLPLDELSNTFNQAFSDYMVKVQLSSMQLKQKILLDRVDLHYSVGAFVGEQCVGVIFTGVGDWNGKKTAYNAGTGVIPTHRGHQLTRKMYDFQKSIFNELGIQQGLLEVIDTNEAAIHSYKKVGFKIARSFDCFVYKPQKTETKVVEGIEKRALLNLPWKELAHFWNAKPSWQNANEGVQAATALFSFLGFYKNDQLVAYGVKDPVKGRIAQFGVHRDHRGQGFGRLLFQELEQIGNPKQSIINIDRKDEVTIAFLKKIGFEYYIGQYEMKWEFKS